MGDPVDLGAVVLVAVYGVLALAASYQMVLLKRARHSGSFFVVLSLACLLCLLRCAFFLKTCIVAGGREIAGYSVIIGVYLLPYALFFTMNSALVVFYARAVTKADSRGPRGRSFTSSADASSAATRSGLFWMAVWMSLVYVAFVVFLALAGPEKGPPALRWFYLLWTAVSDVVVCALIKVWGASRRRPSPSSWRKLTGDIGDRFVASGARSPSHRAGQFGVLNAILCLALFGHALFATLCYADVLPENVRFVYFTGHHPAMSAARTAVFALTECVPVAAYLALFGHIPEKQARNLSVEGDGYVPLRSEGLPPIDRVPGDARGPARRGRGRRGRRGRRRARPRRRRRRRGRGRRRRKARIQRKRKIQDNAKNEAKSAPDDVGSENVNDSDDDEDSDD